MLAGTIGLTWLVWYQTWFGARLTDDGLTASMAASAKPRDVQHGIEEITRRFDERRPGMDRWAKALVEASRREEEPVRISAAWAMFFDPGRAEFVARLGELVASDPSVLVRRNAATSLAKSGEAAARPVLRSMLEPFTVTAPEPGVLASSVAVDAIVRENVPAARLRRDDGSTADVLAPVPGRVMQRVAAEGARVAKGEALLVLAPDSVHVHNAVLGLMLVGTNDDLEILGAAAAPQSAYPVEVKTAAARAMEAIRARGR